MGVALAVALLLAIPRLQSASIKVQEAWFCWGEGRGSLLHLRCEDKRASGQTTSLPVVTAQLPADHYWSILDNFLFVLFN